MPDFQIDNAIVQAYEAILATLQQLNHHIQYDLACLPIWIDSGERVFTNHRAKVVEVLKHFKVSEGLSPQETFACVGVVACTEATLPLIDAVNKAKGKFKALVEVYLEHYQADCSRDTAVIRRLLSAAGYPQLKIKQIYRRIHVLAYHPRRIAFSQVSHEVHRVINRLQAEHMLKAVGQGENIDIQLAQLSALSSKEKLVVKHPIGACWMANVAGFKDGQGHVLKKRITTSIPLFYVHDVHLSNPKVAFSKKKANPAIKRADKLLEDTIFLPSIRAYRYKHKYLVFP